MVQKEIEAIAAPLIEELGCIFWGCEYKAQGQNSILCVYIDKQVGINLEDCRQVSRRLGALLEVEEVIKGTYRLEVSSPGVPRALFYPSQYKQYIGQEIKIKLFNPINGQKQWSGIILASNEQAVTLQIDSQKIEVLFSQIIKAYLTAE